MFTARYETRSLEKKNRLQFVLKQNLETFALFQFESLSCSLPGISDETKTYLSKGNEYHCRGLNQDTSYNKSEASPLPTTDLANDSLRVRIRTSFELNTSKKVWGLH